jgi:poly(A) polymerase
VTEPRIYTTAEHRLTPERIDADAVRVVQRLREGGHQAYIVGGAIRDLLIGRTPKDFDIATSATPDQVHKLFRNSRLIGRRFRIAHVFFRDRKILEVATFQREVRPDEESAEAWGTPEDDARRRDLTINAFFLDPISLEVFDWVDGWADLQNRLIRVVGDPDQRFAEDPVRMIRCIRHSARTGFLIEDGTWAAILRNAGRIADCNASRLSQEFTREFQEGAAQRSLKLLHKSGLLALIMPAFDDFLAGLDSRSEAKRTYGRLLALLDKEGIGEDLPATLIMACAMGPAIVPELLSALPAKAEFDLEDLMRRFEPFVAAVNLQRGYVEPLAQALYAQPKLDQSRRSGIIPRKLRGKSYYGLAMHLFLLRHRAIGSWVPESWIADAPPVSQETPPVDRRDMKRAERGRDERNRRPKPRAPGDDAAKTDRPDDAPTTDSAESGEREGVKRRRRRRGGRSRSTGGAATDATSAAPAATDGRPTGPRAPKDANPRPQKPAGGPEAGSTPTDAAAQPGDPARRKRRRRRGGRGRGPQGAAPDAGSEN